jgi:hypothetical protein
MLCLYLYCSYKTVYEVVSCLYAVLDNKVGQLKLCLSPGILHSFHLQIKKTNHKKNSVETPIILSF